MRVMLRAVMDTGISNEVLESGRFPGVIQALIDRLDPEAVYFGPAEGGRSCTLVFDMQDSSTMPAIAEPLFRELGAKLEVNPVMNMEDLQRASPPCSRPGAARPVPSRGPMSAQPRGGFESRFSQTESFDH